VILAIADGRVFPTHKLGSALEKSDSICCYTSVADA
jgi:hypothetical protein